MRSRCCHRSHDSTAHRGTSPPHLGTRYDIDPDPPVARESDRRAEARRTPTLVSSALEPLPPKEEIAPCTSARPRVLPPLHPNASEPKPRDLRARPWEVTVPTDRYPHDPSLRHATVADHRPLFADPSHPMFPPNDRDRVGRPDGCPLCRHRRRRPRRRFAPPSLPARCCVRSTAEAATLLQHPASACK
jgi:hypothetical protein